MVGLAAIQGKNGLWHVGFYMWLVEPTGGLTMLKISQSTTWDLCLPARTFSSLPDGHEVKPHTTFQMGQRETSCTGIRQQTINLILIRNLKYLK